MDMQSHGTIAGEKEMLVKRPKKEYRRMVIVTLVMETMGACGLIYEFIKRNETPFWGSIVSAVIMVGIMFYTPWEFWRELGGQTFIINQKGITNIRCGKQGKFFRWESFAAIEKHEVHIIKVGSEQYEAVICSTHPIEIPIQPNGERYMSWDYHMQKSNKESVVELVLENNQYAEFLSYIPEAIKESGIVKI